MIQPIHFGFNLETSQSNVFQRVLPYTTDTIKIQAGKEFRTMVKGLENKGIQVFSPDYADEITSPDAVFPNNWFCTMPDKSMHIFPMESPVRRHERLPKLINELCVEANIKENKINQWTEYETKGQFLEGTGSMVMDHAHKFIYAGLSSRCSIELLTKFSSAVGYTCISFQTSGPRKKPIYHTNVMMSIGDNFAVICDEVIHEADKKIIIKILENTKELIIRCSFEQMCTFSCNAIQLKSDSGNPVYVISESALKSLQKRQITQIEKYTDVFSPQINTIESIGGGSARCMIAGLF